MTAAKATVAGLQRCLALEHEAIWVYAYIGARVADANKAAVRAFGSHRHSRDVLIARLSAAHATRPPPLADYAVDEVTNPGQARTVARSLEDRSAAAYLALVGTSKGKDREFAITMLRKAALAALDWGGKPTAFPGLPA
ncbi:MAG: ferritin-like domain-containing protein [Actinomycetota bacterium]|nr:ferritin-like domain-containing protein [Actinomycetota bacterium]